MAYTAYFDGACWPTNPGLIASYGALIFHDGNRIWECAQVYSPPRDRPYQITNNVAEYCGLIAVLDYLLERDMNRETITVFGDSQMAIRQCFGTGKIFKKGRLYEHLAIDAKAKASLFESMTGEWIPRELNETADKLSKSVLPKQSLGELRQQAEPAAPGYDSDGHFWSDTKAGSKLVPQSQTLLGMVTAKQRAEAFLMWRSKRQEE